MRWLFAILPLLVACHADPAPVPHKILGMSSGPDQQGTGFNWGVAGINQAANFNCPDGAASYIQFDGGYPTCIPLTLTGDTTSSGLPATVTVSATGSGTDGFGGGGTAFPFSGTEFKIGPTTNTNRVRLATETAVTTNTSTWVTVISFSPPANDIEYYEFDCIAGDFTLDSGTSTNGDEASFSLVLVTSRTRTGTVQLLSQNGMAISSTSVALSPLNPIAVLDGSISNTTAIAAQAIVSDAGAVQVQFQGPNTGTYHYNCSVEQVQKVQ